MLAVCQRSGSRLLPAARDMPAKKIKSNQLSCTKKDIWNNVFSCTKNRLYMHKSMD